MNITGHSISGYPPANGQIEYEEVSHDDLGLIVQAFEQKMPWPIDEFIGTIKEVTIGHPWNHDDVTRVRVSLEKLQPKT